ncbi:MAG TPA: GNAT family N-acetyltransferase [Hyphomicrobiaceae bacterium]|nr:GNAT family N-acetyltransferase [Hyphomicrobiaceae bacterium]
MVRIELLGDDATPESLREVERIFFLSSSRKAFPSDAARAEFQERWLGRYLLHDRAHAFIARASDGRIAGYLIGSLDDPAEADRFDDIGYFADFADLTALYPAHLHINLDEPWRSQGIGALLLETFAAHARTRRARGLHIVTSAGARNVSFYARCGFEPLRELSWEGSRIIFMGRKL